MSDSEIPSDKNGLGHSEDGLGPGLRAAFRKSVPREFAGGGHSVLKALSHNLPDPPSVLLRETYTEFHEPVVNPGVDNMRTDSESRYQLHGEIARGGMGAIIKGRDMDLRRDLAIKVLLDSHKDNPEVLKRFIEEAQIGGQLQHPGIAPVYELGQFKDKRPFFSMKLIKGKTLAALLTSRRSGTEERSRLLGIFKQVCETMSYVHSRGVIHRDLKPANIMLGAFGEVQVMDWGLAKVLAEGGVHDEERAQTKHDNVSLIQTMRSVDSETSGNAGSHTRYGSVMGTPAYMAPEQALGDIDRLDERADVFGLGAILCEILTGKPPYVSEKGRDLHRLAAQAKLDHAFERLEQCEADADLLRLAKWCLNPDPDERPRDASIVSGELSSYLESVSTRLREAELECAAVEVRASEEQKRRKLLLFLAVMLTVGLLGTGISAAYFWKQQVAQKSLAEQNSYLAEEKAGEAAKAIAATNRANELTEQERTLKEKLVRQLRRSSINFISARAESIRKEKPAMAVNLAREAIKIASRANGMCQQL